MTNLNHENDFEVHQDNQAGKAKQLLRGPIKPSPCLAGGQKL